MKNISLIKDYITRAGHRIAAVEVLYERGSWADVVRESQEIVELCLKALLRSANVEVPRIHDVSSVLKSQKDRFDKSMQRNVERLAKISKEMRRDRELAFYGTEDLTPTEFYEKTMPNRLYPMQVGFMKQLLHWLKVSCPQLASFVDLYKVFFENPMKAA